MLEYKATIKGSGAKMYIVEKMIPGKGLFECYHNFLKDKTVCAGDYKNKSKGYTNISTQILQVLSSHICL